MGKTIEVFREPVETKISEIWERGQFEKYDLITKMTVVTMAQIML